MKSAIKILFLSFLIFTTSKDVYASANDLFLKANEAYKSGDFDKAFQRYNEILKELPSADVYYNMGNAAFKLNHIGQAILYYERARKLSPRDPDVIRNLNYAKTFVESQVEDKRGPYSKAVTELLEQVSVKECMMALVSVYFLLACLLGFRWIRARQFALGRLGVILLTLLIISIFSVSAKVYQSHFQKKAVVTVKKADVRYGPSADDKLAFSLTEGLVVNVDDELSGWCRVTLVSGESGWAPKEGVGLV